jgi:hypothetical protein
MHALAEHAGFDARQKVISFSTTFFGMGRLKRRAATQRWIRGVQPTKRFFVVGENLTRPYGERNEARRRRHFRYGRVGRGSCHEKGDSTFKYTPLAGVSGSSQIQLSAHGWSYRVTTSPANRTVIVPNLLAEGGERTVTGLGPEGAFGNAGGRHTAVAKPAAAIARQIPGFHARLLG